MINIFKLKQNIEHKNMLYILFGVLFEKAFPFILGFLFIKSISDLEYGLWVLYFQVVLHHRYTINIFGSVKPALQGLFGLVIEDLSR